MKIARTSFNRGVNDALSLAPLRWWLFCRLSSIGWKICPEPHRTVVRIGMGTPEDFEARVRELLDGRFMPVQKVKGGKP